MWQSRAKEQKVQKIWEKKKCQKHKIFDKSCNAKSSKYLKAQNSSARKKYIRKTLKCQKQRIYFKEVCVSGETIILQKLECQEPKILQKPESNKKTVFDNKSIAKSTKYLTKNWASKAQNIWQKLECQKKIWLIIKWLFWKTQVFYDESSCVRRIYYWYKFECQMKKCWEKLICLKHKMVQKVGVLDIKINSTVKSKNIWLKFKSKKKTIC